MAPTWLSVYGGRDARRVRHFVPEGRPQPPADQETRARFEAWQHMRRAAAGWVIGPRSNRARSNRKRRSISRISDCSRSPTGESPRRKEPASEKSSRSRSWGLKTPASANSVPTAQLPALARSETQPAVAGYYLRLQQAAARPEIPVIRRVAW